MCTSFAVFASKPFYGMNFDFPDVPLRVRIQNEGGMRVFYLGFDWKDASPAVSGLNAAGLFAASQILVAPFEITHQIGEAQVSPYEVFLRALQTGRRVQDVLDLLGQRRLGYSTSRKGHQLYADAHGETCVLEPGEEGNRIYRSNGRFAVMTNSQTQRELVRSAGNMARLGIDRFSNATRMIQERFAGFSLDDGFEVLQQNVLTRGRYITQCSIMCDPQAREIYLALHRDYEHIWRVSLTEGWIETYSGFDARWFGVLSEEGLTGSELKQLTGLEA